MNTTPLAALALVTVLASTPLRQEPETPSESPVLEAMEGMKTHLKGTAMALQDPAKGAEALEHIAELQRLVLLAKLGSPANLDELPADERDAHRTAFRRDLTLVLEQLVHMELSVLDGKPDEAFARIVKPLYPMREAAHEKYQSKR